MSGYHPGRGRKGPAPETVERIAEYRRLLESGMTLAAVGAMFGVSRQRVHQVIHRQPDGMPYRAADKQARDKVRYHVKHPNARYYRTQP